MTASYFIKCNMKYGCRKVNISTLKSYGIPLPTIIKFTLQQLFFYSKFHH